MPHSSTELRRRVTLAVATASLSLPLGAFAFAPANTSGTFQLTWTDRVGNTHPLANTNVSLYDSNVSPGVDNLVGTWATDSNGNLNYVTSYTRPGGGPLQLSLDVQAVVTNVGTAAPDWGQTPFDVRLPGTYSVNPGSTGTNFVAPAVDNSNDAGKAIGVMQGLRVATNSFTSLGAQTPYVNVRFAQSWGNQSYMSGNQMNLGYDAWGAWDTFFHEYSHGIAYYNNLHISPTLGYSHAFNADMMNPPASSGLTALSPANATQLAWQEGIATYMGTSTLHAALPTAITNMPASDSNTSYDRYSSTGSTTLDSQASFSVDLENKTAVSGGTFLPNIPGKGEGDELSVARILWDVNDNTPNEQLPRAGHFDQVALGPQAVYNLMHNAAANNNGRLIDLWKAARTEYGTTPQDRARLGDLFEANSVSSIPGAAAGVLDGATTSSSEPTLAWTPQDGGHSSKFLVAIYNADWSQLMELSPELSSVNSWTLTSPLANGNYNWVIISNSVMQTDVSFDDSYWSGGASFVVVPEPACLGLLALVPLALRRRRVA